MKRYERTWAAAALCALAALSCRSEPVRGDAADVPDTAEARAPVQNGVELPLGRTLVVKGDLRVRPGVYTRPALASPDGRASAGVLLAEGLQGATIDLTGVTLIGRPADTPLDRCEGWGLVLRGCGDVTIKGGTIGGYKGCIVAEGCRGLVLDGTTFDGWYGMRLRSTRVAEDLTDWLYPHENDQGEWLERYGAAISLTDCPEAVVRGCRGRHGQNGILLVRSDGCRVYDNDFSFLSGWGLGLYRASGNVVSHNRFDYCVRGYSHGVYWRGQDSAGILMFERCSDNLIALNSATHSGDGIFLYAGQDLVQGRARDRGEPDPGGSDRNVFYRNDLSYAVANSLEATFSGDNLALENRMVGSHQHGVWGGYSRRLVVLRNEITDTLGGAVSIEHGQECAVAGNQIARNEIGVELWWDADPDLVQGPLGEQRDTTSRDPVIVENAFEDNLQDIVLKKTQGAVFGENRFRGPERGVKFADLEDADGAAPELDVRTWLVGPDGSQPGGFLEQSTLRRYRGERPEALARALAWQPPELPGSSTVLASERGAPQGLETIILGEWGPWDFESGEPKPEARRPGGLLADARWDATWFSWRGEVDPRNVIGDLEAWRMLRSRPLVHKTVGAWVSPWSDEAVRHKVGDDHFGLIATTELRLAVGGRFRLTVISDDGVRVRIGGRTVLENWTWHAPTRDEAEVDLEEGMQTIELEYFQIDGAAALTIDLERVDPS
jgi:parallel beta-helix repeat protein